jgi:hypothetical protein
MGKKTKFIEKVDSQKFHLLHRSQRDEAHQGYEVPSNFVLVPAVDVSIAVCLTLYVLRCMSYAVCHTLYVVRCMSYAVCHTLYVIRCMSYAVSSTPHGCPSNPLYRILPVRMYAMYVYMYVCICVYVCMYVCMHARMFVCVEWQRRSQRRVRPRGISGQPRSRA